MSVSELSTSTQNYLKTLWLLQEWTNEPVTPTQVAEYMGLRASTISDAMRKLGDKDLVDHIRYGAITLTPTGRRHALAMVRRHRLIETFLVQSLGYTWDEVHEEAEHLEHAVSDMLVDRIDAFLDHPRRDPHGDPIPQPDGQVDMPQAHTLAVTSPGEVVVVERISDDDPALLQYFAEHGLTVGTQLSVTPGEPFSGTVSVAISGGAVVSLGATAAQAVWVSPAKPGTRSQH